MTPGRLWGLLAVLALSTLCLTVSSAEALAHAYAEAFESSILLEATDLAVRVDQAPGQDAVDGVVRDEGGAACLITPSATYQAGASDCSWVPEKVPSTVLPRADVPPVDGQVVTAVLRGGDVFARRSSTGPLRTRVVTAWTFLYGGGAAVVLLVGTLLLRLGRPREDIAVTAVTAALAAVAGGDLGTRAPVRGEPHERELGLKANALAERMQITVERQRTFLADAAHQIRNPLLALQLRLENLEPHVRAAGRRGHTRLMEDVARLGRTLDDLVTFARASEDSPEPVVIDVLSVVQERARGWVPVAYHRDIVLRQRLPASAVALARPAALEQALDALLDNALKHAPARSEVTLVVVPSATYVEVRIEDRGPGLQDGTSELVTGRGWRQDLTAPGSGLGLAIAGMLLSSSGGSLRLVNRTDGAGLSGVIRVPTPAPAAPDRHGPDWAAAPDWRED